MTLSYMISFPQSILSPPPQVTSLPVPPTAPLPLVNLPLPLSPNFAQSQPKVGPNFA